MVRFETDRVMWLRGNKKKLEIREQRFWKNVKWSYSIAKALFE